MQQPEHIITCKHLPAVCSQYIPRTNSSQYLPPKELSCHQKSQKPPESAAEDTISDEAGGGKHGEVHFIFWEKLGG